MALMALLACGGAAIVALVCARPRTGAPSVSAATTVLSAARGLTVEETPGTGALSQSGVSATAPVAPSPTTTPAQAPTRKRALIVLHASRSRYPGAGEGEKTTAQGRAATLSLRPLPVEPSAPPVEYHMAADSRFGPNGAWLGVYSVEVPAGDYEAEVRIDGFRPLACSISGSKRFHGIRLDSFVPVGFDLRASIRGFDRAPLPAGELHVIGPEPILLDPNGDWVSSQAKAEAYSVVLNKRENLAITPVRSAAAGAWIGIDDPRGCRRAQVFFVAPLSDVGPRRVAKKYFELYPVGWLDIPQTRGSVDADLVVHGLPPPLPPYVIEGSEGVVVVELMSEWPRHWTPEACADADGAAIVRRGDASGLTRYRRYVGPEGEHRYVVEPPSWRRVSGVVRDEAGRPIAAADVGTRFPRGSSAASDGLGRFEFEYADIVPSPAYASAPGPAVNRWLQADEFVFPAQADTRGLQVVLRPYDPGRSGR